MESALSTFTLDFDYFWRRLAPLENHWHLDCQAGALVLFALYMFATERFFAVPALNLHWRAILA